jgi:hypothetical protein
MSALRAGIQFAEIRGLASGRQDVLLGVAGYASMIHLRISHLRVADFPTTEEESVNNWGVARDLIWLGPIPPTNLVWEVAYPNAPCQQVPQSGVQQLCL